MLLMAGLPHRRSVAQDVVAAGASSKPAAESNIQIRGTVLDENGDPIAGSRIQVVYRKVSPSRLTFSTRFHRLTTDVREDGSFEFPELPPAIAELSQLVFRAYAKGYCLKQVNYSSSMGATDLFPTPNNLGYET